MNINSPKAINEHKKLIKGKSILNKTYLDFYSQLGIERVRGRVVELGSGGGFLKEIYPKVITSDVVKGEGIDKVFKAEKMPFPSKSISLIVMLDTFHHIKNPEMALKEMERVLKKGGKIVMVEPFNSVWGRFIYQNFHPEDFDPKSNWKIKGKGRMSDANGALPWIVFVRDRKKFEERFPNLKITKTRAHTPLRYLVSGGISKPQLLPGWMYQPLLTLEKKVSFLNKVVGMFATIEITKVKD